MTTALEGGEGSASRLDRSLPLRKTWYPLYRRLGGPQGQSGQVRKISPPTGIWSPDRPARSSVAILTELPSPPIAVECNEIKSLFHCFKFCNTTEHRSRDKFLCTCMYEYTWWSGRLNICFCSTHIYNVWLKWHYTAASVAILKTY
jgi:hypothetical protein